MPGTANALLHHARGGFAGAADPSCHFETAWYRAEHGLGPAEDALRHFLAHRGGGAARPNRFFDPQHYLAGLQALAPEAVQAAAADPYLHYLRTGEGLGLSPSSRFDPGYYRARHMTAAEAGECALTHFLSVGRHAGLPPSAAAAQAAGEEDAAVPPPPAPASLPDAGFRALLNAHRLFDAEFYLREYPDIAAAGLDPLEHYVAHGDREGRRPNRLFDPIWYSKRYFRLPPPAGPFRDYVLAGERAGRKPCAIFDPAWYGPRYGLDPARQSLLAHYLHHAGGNQVSPNRWFDAEYYLRTQPDIAAAGMDGFRHWYESGIHEGRRGSPDFDAAYVWARYLNNDRSRHAFEIFMDLGQDLGWSATMPAEQATVPRQIRASAAPGPLFEELQPPPAEAPPPAAKVFAFYLPQYHPIPENDAWWGAGFTEWRNLPRGVPRFRGHYQPRIPRDLGFYGLQGGGGTEVLRRQVALARRMGVHGFCFYYYNFNGRRLLDAPLDAFAADDGMDFPFSILWANENWTRRWDGLEQDVLIRQDYREEDRVALVDDLARYLTHPRYHRIGGRPVLTLYRADIIPDCAATLERWRACFRERHGIDPILVVAQAFGVEDPRPLGFDGALEFPPHKLTSKLPLLNRELEILDPDFSGQVFSYEAAVEHSLADLPTDYPLIKTATTGWDNDARKQGAGLCLHGATPQGFERWMRGLVAQARRNPFLGEPVVFVNAWNEWCEGAYLEPDCHFGHAYLNALSRAVSSAGAAAPRKRERILLVGHDAFPAGAQQLLLEIGRTLASRFGSEVRFLLLDGGRMLERYREVAPTFCLPPGGEDRWAALGAHLDALRAEGFERAITNTVVAGPAAAMLAGRGFRVCSLVHELPGLIAGNHLAESYAQLRDHSHAVVFPSATVRNEVTAAFGQPAGTVLLRPQGLYRRLDRPADARAAVRAELGLGEGDRIVLNLGHADLRKGVDLFANVARAVGAACPDVHFVWVGDLSPAVEPWVRQDMARGGLRNLHFLPFTADVARYLGAADLFFLSSREDPFPSVVMEALACGLPVLAFEGGGGYVDLLRNPVFGRLVPYLDTAAAASAARQMLDDPEQRAPQRQARRVGRIAAEFDFASYCADLAATLEPGRKRISVVVPNFNYGRYLTERLDSIFDQTYPVHEVILLDDASTDGSIAIAERVAAARGRVIRIVPRERNSGSVFRQWKAGLDLATGDHLWIAEADDLAAPEFLARLVASLGGAPDAGFAFSDSMAVDAEGARLHDDYKGYYAELGDHGLAADGLFPAREFLRRFLGVRNLVLNASAVLWRAEHLRRVFAALGEEAFRLRCAGDWRIYAEACRLGGTVGYCAEPLNRHRRHGTSVTHALDKAAHWQEVAAVHAAILRQLGPDEDLAARMEAFRRYLADAWGLDPAALSPPESGAVLAAA